MLAAHPRATRRGSLVVDPAHWDGLPDGHTRAVTLDPPRAPATRGRRPRGVGSDPLAALLTSRPAAATAVAHRPLLAYDTAAGLTTPVTSVHGAERSDDRPDGHRSRGPEPAARAARRRAGRRAAPDCWAPSRTGCCTPATRPVTTSPSSSTGLGWSAAPPERLAAALISELGEHTVLLRPAPAAPPPRTRETVMSELVTTRIRDHATRLALPHLAEHLDDLVTRAEADTMGYRDFLDLALGEEVGVREGRRFRAALKLSGLPHHKGLDAFDFAFQPDLDPRKIRDLAALEFVTSHSNIALLGPPGVGKTHLAVALAVAACSAGYSIYFTSLDEAVRQLRAAEAAGRFAKKLQTYLRPAVLVLDEVGYLPARPGRGEHGVPADQPPLRTRQRDPHQQQGLLRVGQRVRRRRPGHRHPRPAAAPLPRHQHQRTQLPAQRPRIPRPEPQQPCHDPPAGTDTSGRTPTDI